MEDLESAGDQKLSENASGEENATAAANTDDSLREAEVLLKGKERKLKIRESGLQLVRLDCKSKSGQSTETPVFSVSWVDIICACETLCKKSKGNASAASQNNGGAQNLGRKFAIHYIARKVGSKKLSYKNLVLETKNDPANTWVSLIEERRKVGKPKKLLVIINPVGGSGTGRQTFEKVVQPLFVLAGIELVVRVTERARHAEEIGKAFDFSSVDGVVSVGGDGLYVEVLQGVVVRKQEENGIDYNNPDASLVPPHVCFGIIPAGTGNGITGWWNGVTDVETATLNIIRGESHRFNVLAIFEPGKLVHYSGLHLGYAFFSEVIKKAEDRRWMKKARYPYTLVTSMLGKNQVYDIDVEVLVSAEKQEVNQQANEVVTSSPELKWKKLGVKHVINVLVLPLEIVVEETTDKLTLNLQSEKASVFLTGPFGGMEFLRFMKTLATRNKSMIEKSYIGHHLTKGIRLKLVQNNEAHREGAEGHGVENILNIDGDVFTCSVPDIDVRLHSQFIQAFSLPPD